jgi:hypothetical protein
MSSDYRPRGGSNSNSNSNSSSTGGGPRRRRGGRGRGSSSSRTGEHRPHTNGTSSHSSSSGPKKKTGFIATVLGWFGGNKKSESRPAARASFSPETRESRPPRDRERERGPRPERSEGGERPQREERPARAQRAEPVPQEIVSPKLYVGNLAYEAAESDLFDLFSKVGHVKNVEIATDRNSGRSKGFGFVEMEVLETAKEAAEKLNRTDFMGRQIVVSGAKVDKRPSNPREEIAGDEAVENEGGSSEESSI